jgi:hypothetical protein
MGLGGEPHGVTERPWIEFPPLVTELPAISYRDARRKMASALVRLASDLRALNGHLDLASTAIELGHLEGRPATESTISRTTGLSKQTVGAPAAELG